MIRIALVDDQELVRTGFRMVLDAQPDMTVVGEAADGLAAVEFARSHSADVHDHGRADAADGRGGSHPRIREAGDRRGCSCSPRSTSTSTRSPR